MGPSKEEAALLPLKQKHEVGHAPQLLQLSCVPLTSLPL